MRGWILALAMMGAVPASAQPAIKLPIAKGFWTSSTEKCATTRYGMIFDGAQWGSIYYYGPTGNLGPVAELKPITQTRLVADGFTNMQFDGYDGVGYFRLKSLGPDRALFRTGAPFRDEIQVLDDTLIRCPYAAVSPKMKVAIKRFAPGLAAPVK